MRRSAWKGSINISLMSIPVKAVVATATADIKLNQLHQGCNQRVEYKKVCPDHGPLEVEEIIRGYKVDKDSYVTLTNKELEETNIKDDSMLSIECFIPPSSVDPIYMTGKSYHLVPDGEVGKRPYALLLKSMADNKVDAIAKMVRGRRQKMVLIQPIGNVLVASILYYHHEVRTIELDQTSIEVSAAELTLMDQLISNQMNNKFEMEVYKDTSQDYLKKLIEKKTQEQKALPNPEIPNIINLMDALKKSVKDAENA